MISQRQRSWNVSIGMKHREMGFFFQLMRLAWNEPNGTYLSICGEECPLYVRSSSKRMRTSSSVLSAVDTIRGLDFAHRERSYNRIRFVISLKKIPRTFCNVLLSDSMAFNHSCCDRVFADSIWVTAAFHSSARSVLQVHPEGVFYHEKA